MSARNKSFPCPWWQLSTALDAQTTCSPAGHYILVPLLAYEQESSVLKLQHLRLAHCFCCHLPSCAIQGDMSDMGDSCGGQRFDMVICLLGTFSHMTTNAAAGKCFGEVSECNDLQRAVWPNNLRLHHPGLILDSRQTAVVAGKAFHSSPDAPVLASVRSSFLNFCVNKQAPLCQVSI